MVIVDVIMTILMLIAAVVSLKDHDGTSELSAILMLIYILNAYCVSKS